MGPWMVNYVQNNNVNMDLKQGYGYAIGVFTANSLYGYVTWMLNFKTEVNTMEFTITQTVVEILVTYVNFKIYFMKKEERMKKKKEEEVGDVLLGRLNEQRDLEGMREALRLFIENAEFIEEEENKKVLSKRVTSAESSGQGKQGDWKEEKEGIYLEPQ